MVRDIQSLLDALGVDAVDGGRLLDGFARVRPAGAPGAEGPFTHPRGVGGRLGRDRRPANSSAIADALEADDPRTISDPSARAFRAFADATGADRMALAAIQRAPLGEPAALDRIAVPTMVLTGDADTLVGPPDALAARIPGRPQRSSPEIT